LLYASNGKVRGSHFFATLDGKARRHLNDNLNSPNVWVANSSGGGFLTYVSKTQLFARPFNPVSGEFEGEAVLLMDGVVNGPTFSFAGSRYLAYRPTRVASAQLRWYGRDGQPGELQGEPGDLGSPRLSPDGKRVMFSKRNSGRTEIWVTGAGGGAGEPIASSTGSDTAIESPIWTPDGRIIYSRREGQGAAIVERPADALGAETILVRLTGNTMPLARTISANGKAIGMTAGGGGKNEVSVLSRPGGEIRPAAAEALLLDAVLSPDGRWLAYLSGPTYSDVFVRAVPEDPAAPLPPGRREIASITAPVQQARWSADGKELLMLTGQMEHRALMSLAIVWSDGTPRAGALRKLFDAPKATGFDVTADGRRFIVSQSLGEAAVAPMVLVQNWPALLRK
jgi:hypothetical protein